MAGGLSVRLPARAWGLGLWTLIARRAAALAEQEDLRHPAPTREQRTGGGGASFLRWPLTGDWNSAARSGRAGCARGRRVRHPALRAIPQAGSTLGRQAKWPRPRVAVNMVAHGKAAPAAPASCREACGQGEALRASALEREAAGCRCRAGARNDALNLAASLSASLWQGRA
jgi:hypothetical protein